MALGGMFGAKPLFGQQLPAVTPPYAPGLGVNSGSGDGVIAPATPSSPSFFGQGGVGRGIAGTIGDFLLQRAGAAPIYEPAIQRQQAIALQQRQHAQALQDSRDTWLQQQEWERAHPKPINNDTVNDYNFTLQTLGKEAADQQLARKGDPIVNVTLPGNRFYSGPSSGLRDALAGAVPAAVAPAKPVGKLTPIGGAPSRGGGTF